MAELTPDIPATTQLVAIAWLRWRIFANGFRRQATSRRVAGLVFVIVLRVILWPMLALWVIGPAVGSGFLAWSAVHSHNPQRLSVLLAAIAILWQFIAVNGSGMAATISSFDPSSLLRFPLYFGRYLLLRLLLGLLTPSTIAGCLALLAASIGIAVADSSLAPAAFVVLAIYAAMNIFFSRMIAVWMERWLSTRRAREIFGAAMALFFVSFQFVNLRHTTVHTHAASGNWVFNFLNGSEHVLAWFPPGFAASCVAPGPMLARLAQFAALLAWTALIFAALALRLHKQFLGEYLSEGAPRSVAVPAAAAAPRPIANRTENVERTTDNRRSFLSPSIAACLRKEWVYLRGNGNQLIGMLTPLVFVVIFAKGMLARHPSYLLSGAIGYAMLGLLAGLYNIFGADGAGVQLYLLAPVSLRDVVIAKNIAGMTLLMVETILAWCVVWAVATVPLSLATQVSAGFWVVFVLFANLTLGTLRSIQSPRKVKLGQARGLKAQPASKTSGLLVLGVLLGGMLLQIPVTLLSHRFGNPWLAAWIFAPLAAAAVAAYALLLRNADQLILTHRDLFAEELCGD